VCAYSLSRRGGCEHLFRTNRKGRGRSDDRECACRGRPQANEIHFRIGNGRLLLLFSPGNALRTHVGRFPRLNGLNEPPGWAAQLFAQIHEACERVDERVGRPAVETSLLGRRRDADGEFGHRVTDAGSAPSRFPALSGMA
jgi:hypothetical protein